MLGVLALLYTAQGVPFGFASDYLPVVLRQAHFSMGQIGALWWLQLPWQLKILWAHAADGPNGQKHGRRILLGIQLLLAGAVSLFALATLKEAPRYWFAVTALCALLASTQDVFVDALAVRTLTLADRGLGNTAQVAGYRLGMLAGGGGLLFAVGTVGERAAILACAALVALAGLGAFRLRAQAAPQPSEPDERVATNDGADWVNVLQRILRLLRDMVSSSTWPVLVLAATFKLGMHLASGLLKPMAVDAHWSEHDIGLAVVTAGTTMALVGAGVGGVVHRWLREPQALALAAVLQALVCLPLVMADRLGAPIGWTTASIAAEHFATGLGTTVLFAALMSATRPADAGLHYTILTSANALAIGVGSVLGGYLADAIGRANVFAIAAAVSLAPLALLPKWERAARASASTPEV